MTGDKEEREDYVKLKKQINVATTILAEKGNTVPTAPRRCRRTGLCYRKK